MNNTRYTLPLVLVILAVLFGFYSLGMQAQAEKEVEKPTRVQTTPEKIKVADLSAKGPGENRWFTLTDFEFVKGDVYVVRTSRSRQLKSAYFPLRPKGQKVALPEGQVRVVVFTSLSSNAEVDQLMKRKTITGVLTNGADRPYEKIEPKEWRVEGRLPEPVWWISEGDTPPRAPD